MDSKQTKQKRELSYMVNVSRVTFYLDDFETGINIHHHFFLWRVGDTPVSGIADYWEKRLKDNLFAAALEIINHNETGEIYQTYNDPKRIKMLKQYLLNKK
jgi:hypothetical protein